MYKVIFPHAFSDGPAIRAVTRDFTKQASYVPPELAQAIATLEKKAGKSYFVLNALGSEEYWGSNVNGDSFPERSLMSKAATYGYKTFEKFAHVYRHHQNKDPLKSIGSVKCAAYNEVMHRVELLVEIDNEKGSAFVEKMASGEYPEVSMGCRVPFDQCTLCMNKAATVKDYCECLKTRMNKIAENGVRICARNIYPKFFDISEVIVGADKTAKTLRKVASAGPTMISSATLGLELYGEDNEEKTAEPKFAEIEKEIPAETESVDPRLQAAVVAVQNYEPALPRAVIKKLASFPLGEALSTLSYSGVVLKPGEFQSLVLSARGEEKLANDLESRGIEIVELSERDVKSAADRDSSLVHPDLVTKEAFDTFAAFMPHRSIFEPHLSSRIERISVLPASRLKTAQAKSYEWTKTANPGLIELLGSLGLAYFLYRKGFPVDAKEFEAVMATHPWTVPVVTGGAVGAINLIDAIAGPSRPSQAAAMLRAAQTKTGGIGKSLWKTTGTVLTPVALAYLASASAKRKELEGYDLNPVESVLRDYPALVGPAGVLGVMGAKKLLKR